MEGNALLTKMNGIADGLESWQKRFDARLLLLEQKSDARRFGGGSAPGTENKGPYLAPEQKMADLPDAQNPDGVQLQHIVKAATTGNFSGLPSATKDAMATYGSGGYLLPVTVIAPVMDLMRSQSAFIAAGARTLPVGGGTSRFPKLTSDPSSYWHYENAADITESDATLGATDVTPHTLACILVASVELIEDAPNLQGFLEGAISRSLAQKVDAAAFVSNGDSGKSPIGMKYDMDIATITAGSLDYGDFSDAVYAIRAANENAPLSLVANPWTFAALDRKIATGGDEQPLRAFPSYEALRKFMTTAVPDTEAYIGNFSESVLEVRSDWRLEVSRLDSDSLKKLQVRIRVYGRHDIAFLRPASFIKMLSIGS
jgi:HK97 family phage major capsid protein